MYFLDKLISDQQITDFNLVYLFLVCLLLRFSLTLIDTLDTLAVSWFPFSYYIPLINWEWGHYREISDWGYRSVNTSSRGLRFPWNDQTEEVNYLLYGLFSAFLKKNTIRTPEVIFQNCLRVPWLSSSLILKCFCMLVFLSVIENIVVAPFDHLFCCFRPRASCFYSQLKRAEKSFIMPGHYKKIMPTQQPIRAGVLL